MSLYILKHILFFLIITLVFNQETNKTYSFDDYNETKGKHNQTSNHSFSHNQKQRYNTKPHYDKNRPYNLTIDEMDTMMFCSIIVQETLRAKKEEVENVTKKMNLSSTNPVYEKIGTDIFEQCNKKANIILVNTFIKNLTYFKNFRWDKNFETLGQIDFGKYNNESDLMLTQSQRILMYLYQRVDELFRQKFADERDNNVEPEKNINNQKIKIGNIDVDTIPNSIKFGAFLIVVILLFGGVMYLLRKMEKKPKDKKKNKKKKNE